MFEYFLQSSGEKSADVVVLTSMIDQKEKKQKKENKKEKKKRKAEILILMQTHR